MWIKPADQKLVGEVLAEMRRQTKMTQQELAAKLSKPQSFVSSYEAGQRRVDVLEFVAIIDELRADHQEVFRTILASIKGARTGPA